MFDSTLLPAVVIALVLAALAVFGLKWRHPASTGPMGSLAFVGSILLLPLWAAELWEMPPTSLSRWILGISLVSILLAAAPPGTTANPPTSKDSRIPTTFGVFYWTMIIVLLLPVAGGYLR